MRRPGVMTCAARHNRRRRRRGSPTSAPSLDELLEVKPDFTCELAWRRLFYLKDPNQIALYLDGLRRSGVLES